MAGTAQPVPTTIHSNGMVVATGLGPQEVGHIQNIKGGLLNHAAEVTASTIKTQAAHAVKGGVTMRGSGRKHGGGQAINVPEVPQGGTIKGISYAGNHAKLIGGLNQLRTGATYDSLAGTQPYKLAGGRRRTRRRRIRRIPDARERVDESDVVVSAGKRRRRTKRHGRSRSKRHYLGHIHRHIRSSRGHSGRRKR